VNVPDLDRIAAILIDVDGTLIDSNAAHAEAWAETLTEQGIKTDPEDIRPLVGMGSDKLLPTVAGVGELSALGKALTAHKKSVFDERMPHLRPTRGARELVAYLRKIGKDIVVATSADDREMTALLTQAGVADLLPQRTSKEEGKRSKPDPDIVHAALAKARVDASQALMIGDTPYDIEAAARAGVATIALRCGGHWRDVDLKGATAILDDPAALLEVWLTTSLSIR
jgi:HAD superfamily hydrolase (TIGR01509 family)